MKISKAIKKAMKRGCYIRDKHSDMPVYFKPTNGPNCIIVFGKDRPPGPLWNPSARDLMSDGWELCEFGGL